MSDSTSDGAALVRRIRLAIIANAPAPYRTHVHRRVARELHEVELWSVYTHEKSNAPWPAVDDASTRPICFGPGELAERQADPKRQPHEWRKGGQIIRWLRQQEIGAVAIHGYNDLGRTRIIRWCARNGVPCLLFSDSNIRGDLTTGAKAWVKRKYVRWVVRHCTGFLPCGSLGRQYFMKYGADPGRIHLFPLEPDYALLRALPEEKIADVARRLHLTPGRRRIVFSGRLVRVKRVDLLVDAFAAIAAERPEWDLVIVGDGPSRGDLMARLPSALGTRVHWLGFIDEQEVVSAVYRNCDLLALPSDYEPWALVVNEAAAAGLAIVASDAVGAAAELVRDGVSGAVFPSGNLQALIGKLRAVTDPGRIDALKAGSSGVLEEWRKMADPILGLRQALASVFPPER